uniref:hypothetical protein n=1 Tax=Enterocloster aldenensis TaxID=358742 RepID=UPI001A9A2CA0|nr:MAG TPA: hypothetical protein [Caudoviricetes sp.]
MATVDEILTRQAYAAGDGAWTKDNNYPSYTLYVEPEYVPVTNKRIADFNDQISVRGEQNAQFVGFQLPRYDDGLDLTAAHLYIHYQTVYGSSDSIPCNVSWTDNYIRLCWQVPAQATQEPDRVQMMIYATGTNSMGERVTWKTLPASYTIHDGLDIGGGIPEPDTSWYEQFVAQMEGKVSTAQGYANDAQASKTAAAGSAAESAQSAAASAKALEDNRAYVESQKETFVGYNKRETDLKYANALIGTASGMGRVTVGDAWEAPIPDLEIAGMSGQFSTTGAQMLDIPSLSARTSNGVTFTPNPDGAILAAGTATGGNSTFYLSDRLSVPSGDYYISGCPDGGDKSTYVIKGYINTSDGTSYAYAYDIGDGDTLTVKDGQTLSLAITIGNNASGPLVFRPMLHAGSTPKPWEPYTGGQPSPSPDYPQEILGTDVTSVMVTGAQLMDTSRLARTHNDVTFSVQEDGGILVTGNTLEKLAHTAVVSTNLSPGTYYVSGSVPAADPKIFVKAKKWYSDGKSNVINDASFIVDGTESKIEYFIYIYQGVSDINEIVYPMLNARPTALPYQPYQSSTVTIPLTEPLRGIGDVRDRIMCRDGAWGVERQFVSLTFDGSENWGKMSTNSADKFRFRTSKNKSIIKAEKKVNIPTKILCDRLQVGSSSNTYSRIDCISSSATCDIYIYMEQFSHGDVDAFKAYLSAHPLNAMFERATPTWEPLPSATQSALNALTTYTGTTHVTVTAGGPEPDVGLGYVQDTRAVVADLQAQIDAIRNGGTT